MIELRIADHSDIDAILEIIEEGNQESRFTGEYDSWTARNYLKHFLEIPDADICLAELDGELLGGVMMCASWEWCKQPLGYVVKFWVRKAGRRTQAARFLMKFIDDFAAEYQCSAVYATATAELDAREQKLFENLFYKNGFADVGATLKKGYSHGKV